MRWCTTGHRHVGDWAWCYRCGGLGSFRGAYMQVVRRRSVAQTARTGVGWGRDRAAGSGSHQQVKPGGGGRGAGRGGGPRCRWKGMRACREQHILI